MARVLVPVGTHLNLTAALLEMRKRRHREVRSLAQVTQLIRGGAGVEPRLPSSRDHGASERKMPCHHLFAGRDPEPRGFEFLAHDLTARDGFEPRACVLSKPSLG